MTNEFLTRVIHNNSQCQDAIGAFLVLGMLCVIYGILFVINGWWKG